MHAVGQIIPALSSPSFSYENLIELKQLCQSSHFENKFSIYIASQNDHKMKSAVEGIKLWAESHFLNPKLSWVMSGAKSDVPEQPIGGEVERGAHNRLNEIYDRYKGEIKEDHITIFVAFENGIAEEKISEVTNALIFQTKESHAWVDRAVVKGIIHYGKNFACNISAFSAGVTVPKNCVEESIKSNCAKTAGKFIAERYEGCSHDNWHEKIGGISRQKLMTEAMLRALGK